MTYSDNSGFYSNDNSLVDINWGMHISNDRNKSDYACLPNRLWYDIS